MAQFTVSAIKPLLLTAVPVLPVALLLMPDVGEALFYLLAVAGVAMLLEHRVQRDDTDQLQLLSLLTLGFFASVVIAMFVARDNLAGLDRLDKYAHFLAAPLVALACLRLKMSSQLLLTGVKTAAVLVGVAALVQHGQDGARAGGPLNALVFAYLSLMLGFFSLVRYPLEAPLARLCSLAAFAAACLAVVLAQSRGAWMAAPVLLVAILCLWIRAGVLSKQVVLQIAGCFVLLLLVAGNTSFVQQRADEAVRQYRGYVHDGDWDNSVGQRLIMWDSGIAAALRRPVFGWGSHRTRQAAAEHLDTPEMRQAVMAYGHLHNEYINVLVGRGLVGLASLLLMLGIPLQRFMRQASAPACLVESGVGALLCVGYALAGLSNLAFGHDVMNMFFIYFIALTLPASVSGKHENRAQHHVQLEADRQSFR